MSLISNVYILFSHEPHKDGDSQNEVKRRLEERGGKEQLLLFLNGPAGAGKTTAIKAAETFCFQFCTSAGILWTETTFFYTAYTGSAASAFGGRTITKASGMCSQNITDKQRLEWSQCKILVIDEVSFMTENELMKLDNKLKQYCQRNKVYGGYSIIFGGDFRQLAKGKKNELLYSTESKRFFEQNLNGIIILQNEHRFKNDPIFGKLLSDFWAGDLTLEQRLLINSRVVGSRGINMPQEIPIDHDWNYACPTNKERNSISAGIFKKHVEMTHPSWDSEELPPDHTIIIESAFGPTCSSNRKKRKIRNALRHRILESCGDADIVYGTNKLADPALCLYSGISLVYVANNDDMDQTPPRGNGTVVKFISAKLKQRLNSRKIRRYNNKKVWSVNIKDVEHITVELMDNSDEIDSAKQTLKLLKEQYTEHPTRETANQITNLEEKIRNMTMNRRFNIQPSDHEVTVTVRPSRASTIEDRYDLKMRLLPVNISTASTGHKLQGRSKDTLIITSWPNFTNNYIFNNWEYVVLSRVRTLNGLYLFEPIDETKSFAPSDELKHFITRAKRAEKTLMGILKQKRRGPINH